MSVIETVMQAIVYGLVNGISSLVQDIVNGIISGVQLFMDGIQSMFGIPIQVWESNVSSDGITIPIIMTVILGISAMVALIFIDIYGLDEDLMNGIQGLEEL